jgi:hypothetical protein
MMTVVRKGILRNMIPTGVISSNAIFTLLLELRLLALFYICPQDVTPLFYPFSSALQMAWRLLKL